MSRISFKTVHPGKAAAGKHRRVGFSYLLKGAKHLARPDFFRGSSEPRVFDMVSKLLFGFVNGNLRRRFEAENIKQEIFEKDPDNGRIRIFLHIKHEGVEEVPDEVNLVDHVRFYSENSESYSESLAEIILDELSDLFTLKSLGINLIAGQDAPYQIWVSLKIIPAGCRFEDGKLMTQGYLLGFQIKIVYPSPIINLVETAHRVLDLVRETRELDQALYGRRLDRDNDLLTGEIDEDLREALPIMAQIDQNFGSQRHLIRLFPQEDRDEEEDEDLV
jgi:hypothetical protein